ncbi:MAG: hypothetical protein OXQ94_04390 [Gemmatimonadota bacterium]|nr:hypothetical protein [Gemmatimonadota bacterium]MDE2870912.1 hypothetical protein [Gemmatimonadota bacterium]
MALSSTDLRRIRKIMQEELRLVMTRIGGLESRMDGLERAILVLAENQPGSVPGRESHVTRKVREALEPVPAS